MIFEADCNGVGFIKKISFAPYISGKYFSFEQLLHQRHPSEKNFRTPEISHKFLGFVRSAACQYPCSPPPRHDPNRVKMLITK